MTPTFEKLQQELKRLPGLGYRSAERLALHLLIENPDRLPLLIEALQAAHDRIQRCSECGNICEDSLCNICQDTHRDRAQICVVEQVTDLVAMERAAAFRGIYHVLHGKLSPMRQIGPEDLNIRRLSERLQTGSTREVILALSNDIEGEATCHYLQEALVAYPDVRVTRIGFGLPSGGGLVYADATTLRSAIEGRRSLS